MSDYQVPPPPAPWAATVKPALPAVAQNLENLHTSVGKLEDTIGELRSRLSSVLSPRAQTTGCGGTGAPQPVPPQLPQSSTASSVASADSAIRQLTDAISEIIDMLEV